MHLKNLLNLTGDHLFTLPLVVLYLTDGCNSRCVTCDIWRKPRLNMSLEMVDEIIRAVPELGIRQVLLSGGEAMQHPQWPLVARRFREGGVRVMLLTNGLLVLKQARDVIDHVDELIVSLDGSTRQTYDSIRGVDAFDLVLAGIGAVREGGVAVTTRTTVQRANYRELPQIIEIARSVDVNTISFLAVDVSSVEAFGPRFERDPEVSMIASPGPGAPPEHGLPALALTPDEIDELAVILDEIEIRFAADFESGRIAESPAKLRRILLRYFHVLVNGGEFERPPCNAPHFSAVIEATGLLRPCYFLPGFGRLKSGTPLLETLNAPAAQALRHAYRHGDRRECAGCVCPLYKGVRSLVQL